MFSKMHAPMLPWKAYADLPAVTHQATFMAFHARILAWATEGMDFGDAVESVVAGDAAVPDLPDPELSLVATIGQADADRAEALRVGIESLRTDLAVFADRFADAELSEQLNDRAAAARDFDASGYALPVPDDGDVAIAAAVLGQQIALVIAPMADAGTDVAAEVVLRSMVKIAGREIHKAGADRQLGVDFGYDDTDVETSLLSRTTKPGKWDGSEGTLLARLHWQRATNLAALDQTLQEVSRSPVEAATAQSAASSTIDIANMAAAGHLTYLAPSLQAGYRSVVACQAEAVKAAPDQTLTTVAQQLAVPTTIASRIKLLAELDTDEIRQRVQLLEAGEAPLYVRQSSRGAVYWANM